MNKNDSEFTNLTRAQVEALQECFDFLRCGYRQIIDYCVGGISMIIMKHKRNGSRIVVESRPQVYFIRKNGILVKSAIYAWSSRRYSLKVNSDLTTTMIITCQGEDEKLVSG